MGSRSWYRIENLVGTGTATEVWLYDELGAWGISAAEFVRDLQGIRGDIDLHISSPGGEVFEAIAIFNALRNHRGNVTIYIDGIAASAASFIAMAGDRIVAERTATLMIHDANGIAVGNAGDMRDMADLLEKCSANIASIYAERAGGTADDWRKLMKAETWFTADEAKAAGLVDEVVAAAPARGKPPVPVNSAGWDLSVFNYPGRAAAPTPALPPARPGASKVPANHLAADTPPRPKPADDPPTEAGFSLPDIRDALESLNEIPWDPDLFKAAVTVVALNSPAPAPPAPQSAPEPEPDYSINLPDLRRTLREASL